MNAKITKGNELKNPSQDKLVAVIVFLRLYPSSGVMSRLNKHVPTIAKTTVVAAKTLKKVPYLRAETVLGMEIGSTTPIEKMSAQNILPSVVSPI